MIKLFSGRLLRLRRVVLAWAIGALLAGCSVREEVEQALIGTWWGEDESGYAWCAEYAEGNQLKLITFLPTLHQPEGGEVRDAAQLELMQGNWQLEEGLRFTLNFTTTVRYLAVDGEAIFKEDIFGSRDEGESIPMRRVKYFIKSADADLLVYRDVKEENWYQSKRAPECPERFVVQITDKTETVRGE